MILCGGSAGALCWFEHALSGFHEGPARQIEALGLLPWSCAVHYNEEQGRREAFLERGRRRHAGRLRRGRLGGAALRRHRAGRGRLVAAAGVGVVRLADADGEVSEQRVAGALPRASQSLDELADATAVAA